MGVFLDLNILFNSEAFENFGGVEIIEALVFKGSDMKKRDKNGMLGIHLAAINGNCGIIKKLLEYDKENKNDVRKSRTYKNYTI